MSKKANLDNLRERRRKRIRRRIFGTSERPRLTVFKSNRFISAQVIDDQLGRTLFMASSTQKDLKTGKSNGGIEAAKRVGKRLGELAGKSNVSKVCFDKNRYKFHGAVRALADAARESGLSF